MAERRDLLASFELDEREAAERLERARSKAYWQALAPLAIERGATAHEPAAVDVPAEVERLRAKGYFVLPELLPESTTARLRQAFGALRGAGWPAAFVFVFDEAWECYRQPRLVALLRAALGPRYHAMSRLSAHHVLGSEGAAGWHPHYDGRAVGSRMTVWLAISDATVDNGCIQLVPRDRLDGELAAAVFERALAHDELNRLLHAIKAVPAVAGSALGWQFDVLHWGSMSEAGASPRMSMALELIGEADPRPSELPLFDLERALPTFEERLAAIGAGILSYQRFDPWCRRFAPLGRLLNPARAPSS